MVDENDEMVIRWEEILFVLNLEMIGLCLKKIIIVAICGCCILNLHHICVKKNNYESLREMTKKQNGEKEKP